MGKIRHSGGLVEFSPIIVRIRNSHDKKDITVPLFVQKFSNTHIKIDLEHPDMKYPVFCAMLEKITLTLYKTDIELVRASTKQAENAIHLVGMTGGSHKEIKFGLKSAALATNRIAVSTMTYRIGARQLPTLVVEPNSTVQLTFFLSYSQPQNVPSHVTTNVQRSSTERKLQAPGSAD